MSATDYETLGHHPALTKAWRWFDENQEDYAYASRERMMLALAAMDAELWKFDHSHAAPLPSEDSE